MLFNKDQTKQCANLQQILPLTQRLYERTNRYKPRDVVNTYLNVTFEVLFSNVPTLTSHTLVQVKNQSSIII